MNTFYLCNSCFFHERPQSEWLKIVTERLKNREIIYHYIFTLTARIYHFKMRIIICPFYFE